jgi:hypothetical protein
LSSSLNEGLRGSVRRRVHREIKAHLRDNRTVRRARYSFSQRAVRALIAGRSLLAFLVAYLLFDLLLVGGEAVFNLHFPQVLPGWTTPEIKSLLKDIASYLITAQVGILGMVSVAVGIVTLITQRDDRSSTNTDVRLYYRESLAYEVVVSGAALLIILCGQLLWPVQFLAHLAYLGGADLVFKVALTAFHLAWLLLNLMVFAHFVLTTLHFVERSARERLRERYTANVIVPSDLSQRLLRLFYANAPKELVTAVDKEAGLLLTFGHRLLTEGNSELRTKFAAPSVLHDVWLRPLGFVLRRWWHRSERTLPQLLRRQSALREDDVWLSLEPSFDGRYDGEVMWCRRRGGVAFHRWERWIIRHCYRFRADKYGRDRLPTPSDFLEELADRVIAQIERNAITGFKGAFDELTRFHVFLLEAHNTQTDQGQPISLAEVGDFWDVPYREWIRQYRRVFESAADKIGIETTFIETLGHSVMRLLPSDAAELSPPIVTSLLDWACMKSSSWKLGSRAAQLSTCRPTRPLSRGCNSPVRNGALTRASCEASSARGKMSFASPIISTALDCARTDRRPSCGRHSAEAFRFSTNTCATLLIYWHRRSGTRTKSAPNVTGIACCDGWTRFAPKCRRIFCLRTMRC